MGFMEKVGGFITRPTETFRNVKEEEMGSALRYFIVCITIYGILFGIIYTIFYPSLFGEFWKMPKEVFGWATGVTFIIVIIVMIIVSGVIGIFIGGAWLHLWVWLFGGRKGYRETIKAIAYGSTPSYLLGWIPFINFITGIWALILLILGIKELQEISTGKAVSAIMVAIVIPLAITVILAATIYVWVSGIGEGI